MGPRRVGLARAALVVVLLTCTHLVLLLGASPAQACSCAQDRPQRAIDEAGVAFVGVVRSVGTSEGDSGETRDVVWLMDVEEVFKGDVTETAGVLAESTCSPSGGVGSRHFVLASAAGARGAFGSSTCWITSFDASPRHAQRLLSAAGSGQPPPAGTGPSEAWIEAHDGETSAVSGPTVLAVTAVAVIGGGAYGVARFRRRRNPLGV